jgi:hypothetical protein
MFGYSNAEIGIRRTKLQEQRAEKWQKNETYMIKYETKCEGTARKHKSETNKFR